MDLNDQWFRLPLTTSDDAYQMEERWIPGPFCDYRVVVPVPNPKYIQHGKATEDI